MCSDVDTGKSGLSVPGGPGTNGDGVTVERSGGGGRGGVSNEELFEVLSNRRRRYTLHYLKQRAGDPVEMGDLSTQVAAWETGTDPEALAYDERKRVHTSLYQHHAPKLDDAGIVDYNADAARIEYRGDNRIEEWLAAIEE